MLKNNLLFVVSDRLERIYWCKEGSEDTMSAELDFRGLAAVTPDGPTLLDQIAQAMERHGLNIQSDAAAMRIILAYRCYSTQHNLAAEYIQNRGFEAPLLFNLDELESQAVMGEEATAVVSTDGKNLHLTLHGSTVVTDVPALTIKDEGANRKLVKAVEMTLDKLCERCFSLDRDAVREQVTESVRPLVEQDVPEKDIVVKWDGEDVKRTIFARDIPAVPMPDTDKMTATINNWLSGQDVLNAKSCVVILGHGVAGAPYFRQLFNQMKGNFKSIEEFPEAQETAVLRSALKGTKDAGMNFPLPQSSLKFQVFEVSIKIGVKVPDGAQSVILLLNDKRVDVFRPKSETDRKCIHMLENLIPGQDYILSFISVFQTPEGEEHKAPARVVKVKTKSLETSVSLDVKESDVAYEVFWEKPNIGDVRLFMSTTPLNIDDQEVGADVLEGLTQLNIVDNHYLLAKDFCGERFLLPVLVYGNSRRSGKILRLTALACPQGVRLEGNNASAPVVVWRWGNLTTVRIKWMADNRIEDSRTLTPADAPDGHFAITTLPAGTQKLEVGVSALSKCANGEELQSEYEMVKISLKIVTVDFLSVEPKKGGLLGLFTKKNEWVARLRSVDGIPASNLMILAEEGSIPSDLDNCYPQVVIEKERFHPREIIEVEFNFTRYRKSEPVFFRLVTEDRHCSLRISPETRKIK